MNDSKIYFLVGEKCFFNRFTDCGFKSKWNGLWSLSRKFLEYYAIKINDVWLPSIQKAVEEGLEKFKHFYETQNLKIEETLFVPEKERCLIIKLRIENKNENKENVKIELETALNIRDWNENWNEREYEISYRNNYYVAKCEKGKVIFYSSYQGEFIGYHFYKTHYPSNETQRCFVTKNFLINLYLEGKEVKVLYFAFAINLEVFEVETIIKNVENLEKEKREVYEKVLKENMFSSDINYLNELFKIAILNMKKNIVEFEDKRVFVAGYPWFTQVWGRDSFISIWSYIFDADAAKNTILLFAKNLKNGIIPNFITKDYIDYNSSDSTPLFVIALYKYIIRTGKVFLIEEIKEKLIEIFRFYQKNKNENGFIYSNKNSTWMDSLEREGYCLEVQAFWYYALDCMSKIFSLIEEKEILKEIEQAKKILKKNIAKYFRKDEYYLDVLGKEYTSINQIFLPLAEVIPLKKDFVIKLEETFLTDVGLSTLPKNSKEYSPTSYHKGASWSHLLALLSFLEFKVGRIERALENLRRIYNKCNSLAISSIPEVWNSENGDLIVEKPIGREESAFIQLWSSAMIIKAIDEGLLGLEYDAISKVIKVSPKIEGNFVRTIRIGDDIVTISIEFKEKKIRVNYKSSLGKEYKIFALEEI
ncbi:MAG: amylo-alpha-1,6-glucosidase [Candidatus Aenigmatarchaeota archaeon]